MEEQKKTEQTQEQTALAVANEDTGFVGKLGKRTQSFSSMKPKNDKERAILFNAVNNPARTLMSAVKEKINMKDLYVEEVELVNEKTGDVEKCPRIVIIDDKGQGYNCVSKGIYSALDKIIQLYGLPTWETPIVIIPKQVQRKDRQLLTIEIAG